MVVFTTHAEHIDHRQAGEVEAPREVWQNRKLSGGGRSVLERNHGQVLRVVCDFSAAWYAHGFRSRALIAPLTTPFIVGKTRTDATT